MFVRNVIIAMAAVAAAVETARSEPGALAAIVCENDASSLEKLAAKEIRRYVYLRTGMLLPIVNCREKRADSPLIVVGAKDRAAIQALMTEAALKATVETLAAEQYLIRTIENEGKSTLLIAGGDGLGTLYGVYRFAEHLGVRFYLDGDVIPDERIPLALPNLDETGKPLFTTRGILPFHDFPEGPDLWNLDDYRAVLAQLAKLRMNFIGLHNYSECDWGTEPTVWIGSPDDVNPDGSVRFSPPANYFNTARSASGYAAKKTSDFGFGASQLFADDSFGPDVMQGLMPAGKDFDQRNELYRRSGRLLRDTFEFAHTLGIKTCVGTELPLGRFTPKEVKERLAQQGKNIDDPVVLRNLYRGIFQRAMKTYPLDYYWLWTSEHWTWQPVSQQQIDATMADFDAATAAAKELNAPFALATCGWVLGPPQQPTLFDNTLPKNVAMGCISRNLGKTPIEPGFVNIHGRPKWAIPWLEDDLSMSTPQMWVGRIRKDAVDAKRYGCDGLMGIHWRTRDPGPELAALAAAAWDQKGWKSIDETTGSVADETIEVIGGQTASFDTPVADTNDETLYQTVRYDMSGYRLQVPNGEYSVKLQFCEPVYSEPNKRVFGVTLQGDAVIEELDIFAKAGRNRALDFTFREIVVANGRLEIGFLKDQSAQLMKEAAVEAPKRLKEFPCIAAFVVEGPNYVRKVNCGGGVYRDYLPDLADDSQHRDAQTGDFYLDWATHQFGTKAARPIAEILERIDGRLPTPAPQCPGGIVPDPRPWVEVEKSYAFVDELARLQPEIVGIGNRDRFNYWFKSLCYLKATGRVACRVAELDRMIDQVGRESDAAKKTALVRQVALPLRLQLRDDWGQMVTLLLETVGNWGEVGTVLAHEMFNMQDLKHLNRHDRTIEQATGEPLPAAAYPWPEHRGPDRIMMPTVRTSLGQGEDLKLRLLLLAKAAPQRVQLWWRPMAVGEFQAVPFQHEGRGVYTASLGAQAIDNADLEYYVTVDFANGRTISYPATAPTTNQTVVVMP